MAEAQVEAPAPSVDGAPPESAGPTEASERAGPARSDLATLKPMVETVGAIATQLSLLGAVLVYFGAVSSRVEARFFGLAPSQLDYSTQELVFRSVAPLLGPLSVGGAFGVFLLQLNSLAARRADHIEGWPRTGAAVRAGRVVGLLLLVAGAVWQWRLGFRHSYWSPLFLAAGAVVLLAARGIAAMVRARASERAAGPGDPGVRSDVSPFRALDPHSKLVLGFVVVFAAFGFTARLAQADGFRRAVAAVSQLDERAAVSVLSEEPLIINRRGVACLPVVGSRFTHRYLGLHLLFHRHSRYYLVPSGFDVNNGVVIVLPDSTAIRVEHDVTAQLRSVEGLPAVPPVTSPDPELRC